MWTRAELKTRAKNVLKTSYWKAFLVSIIIGIVGADSGGSSDSNIFNWRSNSNRFENNIDSIFQFENDMLPVFFGIAITIGIIIFVTVFAFRIFVGYPFEVGGRRYFLQSSQEDVNLNYLGYGFGKGKYIDIVKTMLWRDVLLFLWFLLLIIPGIIKSYAYRMVPYILADNPNIGRERAIELSNKMTDGEKFDIWILDLSFIGWYILGTLAFLVGVLFVKPYEYSTNAELYVSLRQHALDRGWCTNEELMQKPPSQWDKI